MRAFFAFLVLFTGIFFGLLVVSNNYWIWMIGYMWSPGLAALAARRSTRTRTRLGWSPGSIPLQIESFAVPLLYGLVAYGLAWGFGLAQLDGEAVQSTASKLGLPGGPPAALFLPTLIPLAVGGTISNLGSSLGEEIGWRGFLHPRLREKGLGLIPTSLLIGLIWATWHFPLIVKNLVVGADSFPWLVFVGFTTTLLGLALVMGWLRERSGSLWTAVVLHSAHNAAILSVFDRMTVASEGSDRYLSESGLLFAAVALGFGVLYAMRPAIPGR